MTLRHGFTGSGTTIPSVNPSVDPESLGGPGGDPGTGRFRAGRLRFRADVGAAHRPAGDDRRLSTSRDLPGSPAAPPVLSREPGRVIGVAAALVLAALIRFSWAALYD
jgi:hypothetical protein